MRVHFLSFSWCFLLLQLGLTFQATSTFGEENVTSSVVVPAAGITGKTIETAGEGKRKGESAGAETREKRETYDDEMYGYGDDSYQTENTYGGNAPEYAEVNENYEEYTVPAPQEPTGVYSEVEGTDDGYGQYQQPYGADQVTGTSYGEDDGTETEDDEGEMDQSEGYGYEEPPPYQYSGDGDYYGESRDDVPEVSTTALNNDPIQVQQQQVDPGQSLLQTSAAVETQPQTVASIPGASSPESVSPVVQTGTAPVFEDSKPSSVNSESAAGSQNTDGNSIVATSSTSQTPKVIDTAAAPSGYNFDERVQKYLKLVDFSPIVTWEEANEACVKDGGHLAVTYGDAFIPVLKEIALKASEGFWVSGRRLASGDPNFKFADDVVLNSDVRESGPKSQHWGNGEPDNALQQQECIFVQTLKETSEKPTDEIGKWSDGRCFIGGRAYLCERTENALAPKSLVAYGLAQALNRRYNQGSYKSAAVSSSYKSSNSYQQNQGAYRTSSYRKPVPLPVPLPYKSTYKRPTSPVYKPAYKEPAYPVNEYEPEHEPQYGGGHQEETEETDGYATKYEEPAEYVDKKEDYTAPGYSYGDAMATEDDGADTYNAGYEEHAAYEEESEYVPKKPIAPKKQYPAAGKGYGSDYDPCKKKKYPETPAVGKYKEEKKSKYTTQPVKYPQMKPKPVKPTGYKKIPPAYSQTPQYTKEPEVPEYLPEAEYENKEEGEYSQGSTNYAVEEPDDYEKAPVAEYQPTKIQYQPKKPDSYKEKPASPTYPKKPVTKESGAYQGLSGRFGLGFPGAGFGGFGGAIGGSATTLIVDDSGSRRSRRRSRSRRSRSSRGRNEDRQTIRDLQAQLAALQRRFDREHDRRQAEEAAKIRAQDQARRDRAEASRQRAAARAQAAFAQCVLNTFNNLRTAVNGATAAGAANVAALTTSVNTAVTSNPNNCVLTPTS